MKPKKPSKVQTDVVAPQGVTAETRSAETIDCAEQSTVFEVENGRTKFSDILQAIAGDASRDRVSVRYLMSQMQGRAIGALLLLFAIPNVIPAPPGTSSILGLPLIYVSSQMMRRRVPWLPGFLADRSLTRADFSRLIDRLVPVLSRVEKMLRPRLTLLSGGWAERLVGSLCFALSIILVLPIPLGNILPALAISIVALGILERDGLWVIAGVGVGLAALALVWAVVYALAKAAIFLFANALV